MREFVLRGIGLILMGWVAVGAFIAFKREGDWMDAQMQETFRKMAELHK